MKFIFDGNGFLYNMVRNLVGTLILVGVGKRTSADMKNIIKNCDKSVVGDTVPAKGLCLEKVFY